MIITAWVLLVPFGFIALKLFYAFINKNSLNQFTAITMFICFLISAICAGVIWGGLFNNV